MLPGRDPAPVGCPQRYGNGKCDILLMDLNVALNIITVFPAVKDDSKKVHYREKIKGYMDRAEQIKDHANKLKEGKESGLNQEF